MPLTVHDIHGVVTAQFSGPELLQVVNLMKPWRNKAVIENWLRILEPMLPPVEESPAMQVLAVDEAEEEEEQQRALPEDEDDEEPPVVIDFGKAPTCKHCHKAFWHHSSGNNRCMAFGARLMTSYEAETELEPEPEDDAKFAVDVQEGTT